MNKRFIWIAAMILLLLLGAWIIPNAVVSQRGINGPGTGLGKEEGSGSMSGQESTDAVLDGQIAALKEDHSLVLAVNSDGSHGGLYTIPSQVKVIGADNLQVGDNVAVGYDGAVEEAYPADLSGAVYIEVKEHDSTVMELYEKVFEDLWEVDPGLNHDVQLIALDLTKASDLDEGQRQALIYMVGQNRGVAVTAATFDQLCEQGYIDRERPEFKQGILLTLETLEYSDRKTKFHAQKWRSGLGAYFFHNCKGTLEKDGWTYKVGEEMIS